MTNYTVNYAKNECVTITPKGTSYRFYRIPYMKLKNNLNIITPDSEFIVYLLVGKDSQEKDCLYVGTATDGIKTRPTSHPNKGNWQDCIVFTSFDHTYLNDSNNRYIEDCVRHIIIDDEKYVNKTDNTSPKFANNYDKEDCDKALPIILEVYDMLGVHLKKKSNPDISRFIEDESEESVKSSNIKIDSLNLPHDMAVWYGEIQSTFSKIDSSIKLNIPKSKQYISFQYVGHNRTVAYCYHTPSKKKIQVRFYGNYDQFNDPRVFEPLKDTHNGDCKALFDIKSYEDLKYLPVFAQKAFELVKKD